MKDERRADQMAYLSKQDGDYLVAQGWASLDRNSGVYYVDRVRDARGDDEENHGDHMTLPDHETGDR